MNEKVNNPQQVNWSISAEQANYLLNVISERPIKEALGLFEELMRQSSNQKSHDGAQG